LHYSKSVNIEGVKPHNPHELG